MKDDKIEKLIKDIIPYVDENFITFPLWEEGDYRPVLNFWFICPELPFKGKEMLYTDKNLPGLSEKFSIGVDSEKHKETNSFDKMKCLFMELGLKEEDVKSYINNVPEFNLVGKTNSYYKLTCSLYHNKNILDSPEIELEAMLKNVINFLNYLRNKNG